MRLLRHELRLALRQRLVLPVILIMAVLASASVIAGLTEIARVQEQQAKDVAAIAAWVSKDGDAGNAAYYTMQATWDAPSPLAFAALGQRDVAPYLLRVRALALEGQIYESENYNAEMALPGRFDWAFVLTYLAPLLLIVLLHDARTGEREAGRLALLTALLPSTRGLWIRRIGLRALMLFAACALPLLIGGLWSGAAIGGIVAMLAYAFAYLAFWTLVITAIGYISQSSVASAAGSAAVWIILTLVIPGLALLAINHAVPVRQGVELTLAQREAVHAGWDKPKDATMQAFFGEYPEYADTKPVEGGFHWKWYYAFQHLGDVSVKEQSQAYRAGLQRRDALTRTLGFVLPSVGVQYGLHRLAETDLTAQLAYQDRIRAYHADLRAFYYPYVFNETPFRASDFRRAPAW